MKLIIFDLDGVLVEARDIHYEALNRALAEVDEKYVIGREEHLSSYDGLSTSKKLKKLTKEKGLPESLHGQVWEGKQKCTHKVISDTVEPSWPIHMLLRRLKSQGYTIYCASNSIRSSVKLMLLKTGYMEFVDEYFSNEDVELSNIFIVGGSYIASNVAKKLVRRKCNVKLIVSDKARARELSDELNDVQIILGEPTNEDLLKDNGVGEECDYFLALTDDDEINVLSALLSNKLKARNSLVVYSKSEYQNVINSIGAEREINTKFSISGEINSYLMRKQYSHETIVDENTKIFEFEAKEELDIKNISDDISLAFILRETQNGRIIIDPEDDKIAKGDYVIAVTLNSQAEKDLESKILG